MAWTLTISALPSCPGVDGVARDGHRRIVFNHGTAHCSNFAKEAPRGDGSTAYTEVPTPETCAQLCEALWNKAKMAKPVIKRARKTNPYAGRPCFH